MNKKLLFLTLMLTSLISYAQFEVMDTSDNSIITDGQVISFAEAGCGYGDPCNWKFSVTNTSTTDDIYMKIFVDNMTGSDGSNVQLCFSNVCLNSVALNIGYPSTAVTITPGDTDVAGNSFWNQNPVGTTTPMSWTLRFQEFDVNGTEIGTPLTVTYNYNLSLGIEDSELSQVKVYPTNVKDELNISTNENLKLDIYDLSGSKIQQLEVVSGNNVVNISNLSSQIYFIRFTNEEGEQTTRKIVKK